MSTIFELENTDEELNKTEHTDTEDGSSSTKTTRHRKTAAVLSSLLLTEEEIFFFKKLLLSVDARKNSPCPWMNHCDKHR